MTGQKNYNNILKRMYMKKYNLPYDFYYNNLPLWIKEIIIIEGIFLNIILLTSLITFIILKHKLKQYKK